MLWQAISQQIGLATGQAFSIASVQRLVGGDINSAFRVQGSDSEYFVKLNRLDLISMFKAEFAGLQELANAAAIRAPQPVVCGTAQDQAFLVLEYIDLGRFNIRSECIFGEQLAQLHQISQPYFGWRQNNTIGSTPQHNPRSLDWPIFWRDQRLGFQLQRAEQNGFCGTLQTTGERLRDRIAALFVDYHPQASLLHGDLWSGNAATDKLGQPVIFDPACYYGDREADIAMTELFGGFSENFYSAYQSVSRLDQGYKIRKTLYNLYHILNHLNLFGSGYLRQAEQMIAKLLAELS